MKKTTVLLGIGFVAVMLASGCQKKETQVSVEEPIVTEETSAVALANMEASGTTLMNAVSAAPSVMEVATTAVAETVTAVIENPTPQQIQEALKSAGYYEGKIDGSVGPKTKRAIEKFQADNGLKADGKVGQKTWAKLGEHLATGVAEAAAAAAPVTEPILGADNSVMSEQTSD